MFCPKCGQEQFCPCKHCRKAHENKVVWEWKGDVIACGKCGLLKEASWWEGLAFDIYCDSVIDYRTVEKGDLNEKKQRYSASGRCGC